MHLIDWPLSGIWDLQFTVAYFGLEKKKKKNPISTNSQCLSRVRIISSPLLLFLLIFAIAGFSTASPRQSSHNHDYCHITAMTVIIYIIYIYICHRVYCHRLTVNTNTVPSYFNASTAILPPFYRHYLASYFSVFSRINSDVGGVFRRRPDQYRGISIPNKF